MLDSDFSVGWKGLLPIIGRFQRPARYQMGFRVFTNIAVHNMGQAEVDEFVSRSAVAT
jgi:hypothetical protein